MSGETVKSKIHSLVPNSGYLICLLGAFLVAATFIAYKPVWNAGYIWDDDFYVTENKLLAAPDGLKRMWFSIDDVRSQYFPLTYTALRIEYSFWGLNSSGYHLFNILLHALNALLLWLLLRRLKLPGSWLAAAIFALHPVHVESVAWITEQKNVLSLFFSLLAMLSWVEFTGDSFPSVRRGYYVLALLFFAMALFAKTTACTLPAAMLLVLWLKDKPIDFRRLVQIVPFAALGIGMGLVSMWVERYHGTHGELFSLGIAERALIAGRAIWFYAAKLLAPVNLAFSYPRWEINPADPLAWIWLAAAVVFCFVVFLWARQYISRGFKAAVIFYAVTLSPLLGFIMLYTFQYTFVADHYQYVASIGPIALVAAGISRVFDRINNFRWILVPVIFGVLLMALGLMTWRQAGVYVDSETLWRDTIAKNPKSALALNNMGDILFKKGNFDEAITAQKKVVELKPDAMAHYNLSMSFLLKGQIDESVMHFEKAVDYAGDTVVKWKKLGDEFMKRGSIEEAAAKYQDTLKMCRLIADVRSNYYNKLLRDKPVAGKAERCRMDGNMNSICASAQSALGNILIGQGRHEEATGHFPNSGDSIKERK